MGRPWIWLGLLLMLAGCAPASKPLAAPTLLVYKTDTQVFMELGGDLRPVQEVPFHVPESCSLVHVFPAPRGADLAIELSCAFGPAVVRLNVDKSEAVQPITDSDSHFLAWSPGGDTLYLRVRSVTRPQVVRVRQDGSENVLPVPEQTYDVAPEPLGDAYVFSYSEGMGLGSEMWLRSAEAGGDVRLVLDKTNYLALARWSPNGKRIAFIKIPDSATPFTVGELWVMDANGGNARKLADADAGHGYAPAWSPDSSEIAYVVRENPTEARANESAAALQSNLYVVDAQTALTSPLTDFEAVRVEAPVWSPDGSVVAFSAYPDDRMTVYLKNLESGEIQKVPIESVCCAGWIQR